MRRLWLAFLAVSALLLFGGALSAGAATTAVKPAKIQDAPGKSSVQLVADLDLDDDLNDEGDSGSLPCPFDAVSEQVAGHIARIPATLTPFPVRAIDRRDATLVGTVVLLI